MSDPNQLDRLPSVRHCAITLGGLALWISFGLFVLEAGLHGVLMIGLVWVAINSVLLDTKLEDIQQSMRVGMDRAMPAMFIFLMIGIVIATFILSGTIASLIYYGLKFIHPAVFLPAGLILCSLMSLAVGTSWGTVATGGIVLIGIGGAMGIPLPLVAGMIVSGASFGDKMSPVSDTTNLAAMASETELYSHIKSMAYTTGPTYLLCLVAFSWLGFQYAEQPLPQSELNSLLTSLEASFTISIVTLLPLLVLLVLSFRGMLAEAAMMIAALVAVVLAVVLQGHKFAGVLSSFYDGAVIQTGNEQLDPLLNKGGIVEMAWTFTLVFIAIALGAILEKMGFLAVLMQSLLQKIKRAASLVSSAIISTFFANMLLGESYVSMILSGQVFKQKFDKLGVDRRVLSRSLEEGGTLLTALIPWTTTGAFYTATLGISTLEYAQWSLLNWLNPLVGILFAWLGIALFRTSLEDSPESGQ